MADKHKALLLAITSRCMGFHYVASVDTEGLVSVS